MYYTQSLKNKNILRTQPVLSPAQLSAEYPLDKTMADKIAASRKTIKDILTGDDKRLLVIVGPCSVHEEGAAVEYAKKLALLSSRVSDRLFIVMRLYFEKPRTLLGWRGLIVEPDLDGVINVEKGLRLARSIACTVTRFGLPIATEFLDPVVPQYLSDLVSWASVGARSTESQIHRELASGLPMPVGFKNATDGDISCGIHALVAAQQSHAFLGITDDGRSVIMHTSGNRDVHLVLRGSNTGPNYGQSDIKRTLAQLKNNSLPERLIIDCSHGNSGKNPLKQMSVARTVLKLKLKADAVGKSIRGIMLESFLKTGCCDLNECRDKKNYGLSVTDGCLGWNETETLLLQLYESLTFAKFE